MHTPPISILIWYRPRPGEVVRVSDYFIRVVQPNLTGIIIIVKHTTLGAIMIYYKWKLVRDIAQGSQPRALALLAAACKCPPRPLEMTTHAGSPPTKQPNYAGTAIALAAACATPLAVPSLHAPGSYDAICTLCMSNHVEVLQ